jgi:hypothetical protein
VCELQLPQLINSYFYNAGTVVCGMTKSLTGAVRTGLYMNMTVVSAQSKFYRYTTAAFP